MALRSFAIGCLVCAGLCGGGCHALRALVWPTQVVKRVPNATGTAQYSIYASCTGAWGGCVHTVMVEPIPGAPGVATEVLFCEQRPEVSWDGDRTLALRSSKIYRSRSQAPLPFGSGETISIRVITR